MSIFSTIYSASSYSFGKDLYVIFSPPSLLVQRFFSSTALLFLCQSVIVWLIVIAQVIGLGLGIASINHQFRNKYIRMIGYYSMTVIAQMIAAFKQITGKTKATWEKAESTR